MSNNIAVQVKGVKKRFKLPQDRHDSLKMKIFDGLKRGNKNKDYTIYEALKGIDLNIKKGEFMGILGRNGAGKSTLLKIISEIYQPSEGSVRVNGKLVPFIELGVGFNPNLTGKDNIYLNGAMLGFSRKEIDKMYDSIVEFAELEEFMGQKLKNYSSGQRVRLAFSIAIRANADVLLLDEVLAVGDAAFQKKCTDYFKTLRQNNKTIILVTHNMATVRAYCSRVAVIDDGRVVFDGNAHEAAEKYLSLFNIDTQHKEIDTGKSKPKEYVDKKIRIKSLRINNLGDKLVVSAELWSSIDKDNVKFGFRILDSRRRIVAGANTMNAENPIELNLRKNQTIEVRFTLPNMLGDGDHSIDARVGSTNPDATHDKASSVGLFSNTRSEAYYPIVLPAKIEVRDIG